ncbi:MAG: diaminobutyrate--2-oxoglutarate transaminase [Methylocystaceae bacterium]|nr:diaminobutyrate--2-oxoglutarate transaminase [Methylocystaceae bacterium]
MRIFEQVESQVRGYVRSFPAIFDKAEGALLFDEHGNRYLDFFAGAGTLNYGHNHPLITEALIEYLKDSRIVHGLDKATAAKRDFLETFVGTILEPRNMEYKVQFTGPTGTNSVETAMKLARLVKQRSNIIAFTNGYHGLTMGSLSVTGNSFYRDESYGVRANTDFMPFDGYMGEGVDTIEYLQKVLSDQSSGIDLPAAVIVETIQGEGGINVASVEWLQRLEKLCRDFDILLIIDDIQMGNGRTGRFFSFEEAGIRPDMITLSKSLGGGLPFSILLMRPELDQWQPGEHTGTFRGNNLAFVAATQALKLWEDDRLGQQVREYGDIIKKALDEIVEEHPDLNLSVRGRGMAWGLDFGAPELGSKISEIAFEKNMIVETAGADSSILKLLPPLIIDPELLSEGLEIIKECVRAFKEQNTTIIYQEAS